MQRHAGIVDSKGAYSLAAAVHLPQVPAAALALTTEVGPDRMVPKGRVSEPVDTKGVFAASKASDAR